MKIKYFHNLRFSISKSRFDISKLYAMAFVKEGRPMVKHLSRVVYLLGGSITPNWVRLTKIFLKKVNHLKRKGGIPMVVKYLKVSSILIQQVCAGYVLPDITPLGVRISRSKSGLPRFIPAYQRKLIMRQNHLVIKFWLTLCSLYRDLSYPGKLSFKTITNDSTAYPSAFKLRGMISNFTALYRKPKPISQLKDSSPFPILTSGPQVFKKDGEYNSHTNSVFRSFKLITSMSSNVLLHDSMLYFLNLRCNSKIQELWTSLVKDSSFSGRLRLRGSTLGRLAIKEEAAGKVRVFAMVDPWTQWVLYPLHKFIFSFLRTIPMDGTFDQLKPLDRVPWGRAPIYSFDLSSATDRLPIWLQESLLEGFFGKEFATHWSNLLVGRDYALPSLANHNVVSDHKSVTPIRYKVGQPMGALSSWGMLALTHHYIVQYCAWDSFVTPHSKWFTDYSVLGDDIIIWNRKVASRYLSVLKELGVTVGLAKSVISPKGVGLEFAKKTLLNGIDVSPIPFKEQSSAHRTVALASELSRKYSVSDLSLFRFLGYGYKVDPTKDNSLVRTVTLSRQVPKDPKQLLSIFSLSRPWLDWGALKYPLSVVKKTFIIFVWTELQNLRSRSSEAYTLAGHMAGLGMKSSGPWRARNSVIDYSVYRSITRRYIEDLLKISKSAKVHMNRIHDIHEFYTTSIIWDSPFPDWKRLPYSDRRMASGYPKDALQALNFIFSAYEVLDRISTRSIYHPSFKASSSMKFSEEKSILRRWNRWARLLSKVGIGKL